MDVRQFPSVPGGKVVNSQSLCILTVDAKEVRVNVNQICLPRQIWNTLAQATCVFLQWIPVHTGISGNEMADQLAKEWRKKEQPPSHLSYREVKTLILNKKKAIFHSKTGGYKPNQDALHQLPRLQQTTIFRLRTGHCRLNGDLKRICVKTSAQCLCGAADQTPEHYLQSCSLYHQARQQMYAHLCVPQNQGLEICRGFVPDIQVCGTHGREDLINATITSNVEEEDMKHPSGTLLKKQKTKKQ